MVNNPGRIAPIEMHISTSYPLGLAEAYSRWHWYPAPYWYGSYFTWATPWLWIDGDKNGSWVYSQWATKIAARMAVESPVTITMWGDWWPAQGTGTVYAQFRNDSNDALGGRVLFVVTEDSCYYPGGNGDVWHNHVARDYIPNHIGEPVSIAPGDSITLSANFTLGTSWNPEKIKFVTFIQDTALQLEDTIIQIWQGGILDIDELGIEEFGNTQIASANIAPIPNPCTDGTRFSFTLSTGAHYRITLYDITGRKIQEIDGIASGSEENVEWNVRNEQGVRVSSGVYLYRFESDEIGTTGKIVVR